MYTNLFEATADLEALQEWWSYTEDPPHVEYTMTMRVTSTCDETMRFGFQGLGGAGAFLVAEVPANADARYIEVTGVIGRSTSDYHVRNSYAATIDTCEVTFSDIKFSLSECVETAVPTQSPTPKVKVAECSVTCNAEQNWTASMEELKKEGKR